jgi:3-phosphoshikimate 1-carboxyvinyltransferase
MKLRPSPGPLSGEVRVPGDKSVSHRAVMCGALCEGRTEIDGFGPGADNLSTVEVFRALSVAISVDGDTVVVDGRGPGALRPASGALDCGNSGTTMRLATGLLAGLALPSRLIGDESLSRRPMGRVTAPLSELGASCRTAGPGGTPPVLIEGGGFEGGAVELEVASAQVKSALLLAALTAHKAVQVREPSPSRDHTEVMLRYLGVPVVSSRHYEDPSAPDSPTVTIAAFGGALRARPLTIPGDISSAAFLMVAAALVPASRVRLTTCGWSPTRTGIAGLLAAAGVQVRVTDPRELPGGEPACDLEILAPAAPTAFVVDPRDVPRLIDEIPVLAVLAGFAEGTSEFHGVAELRVKESDRLRKTVELLRKCGCIVDEGPDSFSVTGRPGEKLRAFEFDAELDHRMAAAAVVASLVADGPCSVIGLESLAVSYPNLLEHLRHLE